MILGVSTTCHTQYTWDRSICIFLFNRTTLQVFVTYLTGALFVHPLWFYKHQHASQVYCIRQVVKTPTIISNNRVFLSLRFCVAHTVTGLKYLEPLTSLGIVSQRISSHLALLCPPSEERYIRYSEITVIRMCGCMSVLPDFLLMAAELRVRGSTAAIVGMTGPQLNSWTHSQHQLSWSIRHVT